MRSEVYADDQILKYEQHNAVLLGLVIKPIKPVKFHSH